MSWSPADRLGDAQSLAVPPVTLFALGGLHLLLVEAIRPHDVLFAVVPGLTLLVGAFGIVRSGISPSRYSRILRWTGVSAVVASVVPVVMLQTPFVTVTEPHIPIITGLWLGATGGLVAGSQEARAIERTQESERSRLRAQLAEQEQERLEHLNHLLRHDILNSVAVIEARAEFVIEDGSEYDPAHVQTIHRQARSIIELIQNVRSYLQSIKTEDGTRKSKSLSAVLTQEVATLESNFPECIVTADVCDGVSVVADDLLGSVFSNLLRNAVIHNRSPAPTVSVSMTCDDDVATVRITDNGTGISDHARERLFDPNDRGDHGFGLYLVKTLVDRYGGTVEIESAGESGTTFSVTLLLADA